MAAAVAAGGTLQLAGAGDARAAAAASPRAAPAGAPSGDAAAWRAGWLTLPALCFGAVHGVATFFIVIPEHQKTLQRNFSWGRPGAARRAGAHRWGWGHEGLAELRRGRGGRNGGPMQNGDGCKSRASPVMRQGGIQRGQQMKRGAGPKPRGNFARRAWVRQSAAGWACVLLQGAQSVWARAWNS